MFPVFIKMGVHNSGVFKLILWEGQIMANLRRGRELS